MIFSSSLFLYFFLPAFVLGYLLTPWKNAVLLAASLIFYAWGEPVFIAVLLAICVATGWLGRYVTPDRRAATRRLAMTAAIVINIGTLLYFKYAGFFVENLNALLAEAGAGPIAFTPPHLPLGVSFFVFQAVTYVVDVHRGEAQPARRISDVVLYISLFPQLVAGPIVRYNEIAREIDHRSTDWGHVAAGTRRFITGLAKKVLVADVLASTVDTIFTLPDAQITPGLIWFGGVCFGVQIYFDFSGYSDMAIGIAQALGFKFPENFNRPYVARSVQDFWHRWHMTLSRWFRDYVYIPLGGNRKGSARTFANLLIVFFVTGLWHGAAWNFIAWGMLHGTFLIIERLGLKRVLDRLPGGIGRLYTWVVVLVGWVLFRAETSSQAWVLIGRMFGIGDWSEASPTAWAIRNAAEPDQLVTLGVALLICVGFQKWGGRWIARRLFPAEPEPRDSGVLAGARLAGFVCVFVLCMASIASNTQLAFIYFRF